MKIDAYSDKREAHVEEAEDAWRIYPVEFALFVKDYELPDEVPVAYPGVVKPDINSKIPYVVTATWKAIMEAYLSVDDEPYEFEFTDVPESEVETEEDDDVVY